jgi:ankyrin
MLHLWVEKNRNEATGNALERALKAIRREDIINKCIRTMEEVTDVSEKRAAKAQLEALGEAVELIHYF